MINFNRNNSLFAVLLVSVFQLQAMPGGNQQENIARLEQGVEKEFKIIGENSKEMSHHFYKTFLSIQHPEVKQYSRALPRDTATDFDNKDVSRYYRYGFVAAIAGTSLLVGMFLSNDKKTLAISGLAALGASYLCEEQFKADFAAAKKEYPLQK